MLNSWKGIALLGLLAGLANTALVWIAAPSSDALINYAQIRCFGEQFWQGYLYPRWCMEANLGLGSPVLLYYFPLPFYVSSLFYPLIHVGASIHDIYALSNLAANITLFITGMQWLRTITTPKRAAFFAFILLWLPYHMEVQVARRSYAELWCLSLLPLVFLYARQVVLGIRNAWPKLALSTALCLLAHAPAAMAGLTGAGLHALFMYRNNFKTLIIAASAVLIGFLATLFHWVPAKILAPELSDVSGGFEKWRTTWVNDYADNASYVPYVIDSIHLLFLVTFPILLAFGAWMWLKRKQISDALVRREVTAWAFIMLVGACMMFSFTTPLWMVIEAISQIKIPWRMQGLVMFSFIYLLTASVEWLPAKDPGKRAGNAVGLAMLCILMGVGETHVPAAEHAANFNRFNNAHYLLSYFLPHYMDPVYAENKGSVFEFERGPDEPSAHLLHSHGTAEVTKWGYGGIEIAIDAKQADTLRIEQFYFPVWHATLDGKPLEIKPENKQGRMLLEIPPGKHEARFTINVAKAMPGWFPLTWLVSLAAFLIIGFGLYRSLTTRPSGASTKINQKM